MFDEKEFLAKMEESQREFERRSKELIPVRMKIGLEGFVSDVDRFEMAPELIFRKAPLDERQAFYGRTNNPNDIAVKAKENEFFIDFDFNIPRGSIQGLAPTHGITVVSIFLTVFSSKIININKGNFYLVNGDQLVSAGFHISANEYRFATKTSFSKEDLEDLQVLWPLFQEQFESNSIFNLVVRRYYYSLLRLNTEDKIIDMMISLEALLIAEKNGSKGDKIALRLAALIQMHHNFAEILSITRDAYRNRNKIVHGSKAADLEAFDTKLMSQFCRTAIREYLVRYRGIDKRELIKELNAAGYNLAHQEFSKKEQK